VLLTLWLTAANRQPASGCENRRRLPLPDATEYVDCGLATARLFSTTDQECAREPFETRSADPERVPFGILFSDKVYREDSPSVRSRPKRQNGSSRSSSQARLYQRIDRHLDYPLTNPP